MNQKHNVAIILPKSFELNSAFNSVKNYYEDNENVIFFDFKKWYFKKNNQHIEISSEEMTDYQKIPIYFSAEEIINQIRKSGPLWSRWTDRGDQYELFYRKAMFEIYELSSVLKKLNIKRVVFPTSISHHIDTLSLEISCNILNIKQIFPYAIYLNQYKNIYGRLLPLVQVDSVENRKVLHKNISNYEFNDDLNHVTKIARQNKWNLNQISFIPQNYIISIFILFYKFLRSKVSNQLRFLIAFLKRENQKFGIFPEYSILTVYKQMRQQKKAMKYYKSNIISTRNIHKYKNEDNIVIAAHHQPEATSFPEGNKMHNHIDIVFELRRKGFKGNIFYKEHPGSLSYFENYVGPLKVGQYRSIDYYKQLKKLDCLFLNTSFELSLDKDIEPWYVPITITGTIALERSLSGYHTIITGFPWFKNIPGILHLSKITSLSKIDNSWKKNSDEIARSSKDYLKKLVNNKTIINAPGIGTGINNKDEELEKSFLHEFNNLINHLIGSDNV